MWHDWGSGGWAGWLAMTVSMILFWGVIIALVVWAVRQFRPDSERGGGQGARRSSDALWILEERFARGEIDREEFEHRKAVLRGR